MKYFSQSYVYVNIFGDKLNPTDFTNLIGIQPTDFGLKGDIHKFGAILKESFWKYQLRKTNALEELEDSLKMLVDSFYSKESIIKNYLSDNNLNMKCSVVIESKNNEDNGVDLNLDFINFLHEFNASIEISFYPQ